MPFDGGGVDITVPAAADLSAYQYRFITLNTAGRGTVAGAAEQVLGVLQNKPSGQDRAARVRISGISLFYYGASVTAGDMIASGEQGAGTTTTTAGIKIGGLALFTVGGSGDISSMLVRPHVA